MKKALVFFALAVLIGQMQHMGDVAGAMLCLASFFAGTDYHKYTEEQEEE